MGTEKGQIESVLSAALDAVKKNPSEMIKWTSALSAIGGLVVLVVHAVSIRYLPELGINDIATVLSVTLLIEIWFAIVFAFMSILPAILMFWSIGPARRVTKQQVESSKETRVTTDHSLTSVMTLHVSAGIVLVLVFLAIVYFNLSERPIYFFAAILMVIAIPFAVDFLRRKMSNWLSHSALPVSVAGGRGSIRSLGLKGFSLLLQMLSVVVIVIVAAGGKPIERQWITVTYLSEIILAVAAVNVGLLAVLRNSKKWLKDAAPIVVGFVFITFVVFGATFEELILRKLSLAYVGNVSLAINNKFYSQAAQYGFGCANSAEMSLVAISKNVCVIRGYLITRVGQNYVMEKSQEVNEARDRSTGYFIVPKDHAIWIPSS